MTCVFPKARAATRAADECSKRCGCIPPTRTVVNAMNATTLTCFAALTVAATLSGCGAGTTRMTSSSGGSLVAATDQDDSQDSKNADPDSSANTLTSGPPQTEPDDDGQVRAEAVRDELGQRINDHLGAGTAALELLDAHPITLASLGHPCPDRTPVGQGAGVSIVWDAPAPNLSYASVTFDTPENAAAYYASFDDAMGDCLLTADTGKVTVVDIGSTSDRYTRRFDISNGTDAPYTVTVSFKGDNVNIVIAPNDDVLDDIVAALAASDGSGLEL
jgi:hypothetical protein